MNPVYSNAYEFCPAEDINFYKSHKLFDVHFYMTESNVINFLKIAF